MDIKKIIYDSNENRFILDGDMIMSLEDVRDRFNETERQSTKKQSKKI